MSILQQTPLERVASLQPNCIVLYKVFPRSAKPVDENSIANLTKGRDGEYNGYMSPATARQVKRMLSTWLQSLEGNMKRSEGAKNKFYPTFITLTLPSVQQHTDNFIKREFLNRLIVKLKRKAGVMYYFWRAESQENGNIHFHLLVDKWIGWEWLRDSWNAILDEHGYIDEYRRNQLAWHSKGFKMRPCFGKDVKLEKEKQKKAYEKGMLENWKNPNTTDIHKLDSIDNVAAYVVKYVTKKPDVLAYKKYDDERGEINCVHSRPIEGRVWGCSDEIRELRNYVDTYSIEFGASTSVNVEVVNYVAQVEQEVGSANVFEDEYIKVVRLKEKQDFYLKKYSATLHLRYRNYYSSIYISLYVNSQVQLAI